MSLKKENIIQDVELKKQFQDEIRKKCKCCGKAYKTAYWDYELESYIYLSESALCLPCKTAL